MEKIQKILKLNIPKKVVISQENRNTKIEQIKRIFNNKKEIYIKSLNQS